MKPIKKTNQKRIVPLDASPVYAYFKTDKETRLHFLIQGHYNTTPARDNIVQDDPWNLQLIDTTAELVARSLVALRDLNMMSVDVLQSMPIRPSEFPEGTFFTPFIAVLEKL